MRGTRINASAGQTQSSVTVYRKVTITIEGTPTGETYRANAYPNRVSGEYYEVPVYKLTVSGKNDSGADESKTWDVLRFMPYHNPPGNIFMSGLADPRKHFIPQYKPDYKLHNTYSPENGALVIHKTFYIHDGPDDIYVDQGWGAAGCVEVCGASGFDRLKKYIAELSGYKGSDIENHLVKLASNNKIYLILERAVRPALKSLFK